MDGDEILALIVSSLIAAVGAGRWYAGLARVTRLGSRGGRRFALGSIPLACIVLVQAVLSCCSAREVRDEAAHDVLFLVAGAAWLAIAAVALHLSGISPRQDALENRNDAAAIAVCGAWVGASLCYAGGNIGEGATVWTTFVPAAEATAALFVSLRFLQLLTSVSESISIDRDNASAARLAGFFVAAGLILGRAVAGDFHSWEAAWRDFLRLGWPVLPMLAGAIILQMWLRPTPRRPEPKALSSGLFPALAMLIFAMIELWISGLPEHGPKGG